MSLVPPYLDSVDSAFSIASTSSVAVLQVVDKLLSNSFGSESIQVCPLTTSVRERSAEETLKRIAPVLHKFGVNELIDLTLDGVPSCPVFQVLREDMRSGFLNAGKGYTAVESAVSGLMEAIEVCCFERMDSFVAPLSSEIGETERCFRIIPTSVLLGAPPTTISIWPNNPIRLVKGWDFINEENVWLHSDDVFLATDKDKFSASTANGIASGNSVSEALCHAIGEILERHALAGFIGEGKQGNSRHYQQHQRVMAPLNSERIQMCIGELRAKDVVAEFLLISCDAGVSVFICSLSVLIGSSDQRAAVQGFGAHPDAGIAMARALAEAVQILALCPVLDATIHSDITKSGTILTSKQLAELDPSVLLAQRIAAQTWLDEVRNKMQAIEFDFLDTVEVFPQGSMEATEVALQKLVNGLKSMGCTSIYYCVISPPDLPVVVVKCFCPALDCISDL